MAIEEFDVFVMGTGNAGKNVAFECAAAGKRVAIADNREYGGTCANRGCDPKKVIVGITEAWQAANYLEGKGISDSPVMSWSDLHRFKETFTSAVPFVNERRLREAGIVLYHQSPRFIDPNTLSVEGKTVRAKKTVIATGQISRELKIQGREYLRISDDFMDLEELPESMIFIGGGYIGMEFAHVAARFGVKVTIIQPGDRPLKGFDNDIVRHLVEASQDLGIRFIFHARADKIEKLQKNFRVYYDGEEGEGEVTARMVFNTAGRVPAIGELNLEKGKVAVESHGITVNEFLQSPTNPDVYACGDVSASGLLPLTPTSHLESKIVSTNILHGNSVKLPVPPVPTVAFTIPQVAAVGLTEEEARKRDMDVEVKYQSVSKWFSAKHRHEPIYAFKIISDKSDNTILGAHLIGGEAGEMINLFTMAIQQKMTVGDIQSLVLAYPTRGNDIRSMV